MRWRLVAVRNVVLGFPQLKYDYMIAFEGYGPQHLIFADDHLQMLVVLAVRPSCVERRALHGRRDSSFRMVRRAFGAFTAFSGPIVLAVSPDAVLLVDFAAEGVVLFSV